MEIEKTQLGDLDGLNEQRFPAHDAALERLLAAAPSWMVTKLQNLDGRFVEAILRAAAPVPAQAPERAAVPEALSYDGHAAADNLGRNLAAAAAERAAIPADLESLIDALRREVGFTLCITTSRNWTGNDIADVIEARSAAPDAARPAGLRKRIETLRGMEPNTPLFGRTSATSAQAGTPLSTPCSARSRSVRRA
jgi:hypothetical protein